MVMDMRGRGLVRHSEGFCQVGRVLRPKCYGGLCRPCAATGCEVY